MLRQTSLGLLGLTVGSILTLLGIYAYATGNATLNLAGFFYGIPVLLGGLALKAAELKPVPYRDTPPPEVTSAREQQATDIQNQIRRDVTRYRYGQAAHLDIALEKLGLSPTDEERPVLTTIQEKLFDGAYGLVLEFDSPLISLETWESKREKMEKFFGPNVRVVIDQPQENVAQVAIIKA